MNILESRNQQYLRAKRRGHYAERRKIARQVAALTENTPMQVYVLYGPCEDTKAGVIFLERDDAELWQFEFQQAVDDPTEYRVVTELHEPEFLADLHEADW